MTTLASPSSKVRLGPDVVTSAVPFSRFQLLIERFVDLGGFEVEGIFRLAANSEKVSINILRSLQTV